jgi:hypothetical protein
MAWSNSKAFCQLISDVWGNTTAFDYDADTIKVALYNNSITPDQSVSAANSAYNAGQWAVANEQSSAGQWAAGGVALASKTNVVASPNITIDAADTASGATATLASVFGCLVYDDTLTTPVADQGMSFNYFGGTNSVTSGTFTVVWNSSGIMRFAA